VTSRGSLAAGGTGLVGAILVRPLAASGYRVRVLGYFPAVLIEGGIPRLRRCALVS
jgi:hypothetical protein